MTENIDIHDYDKKLKSVVNKIKNSTLSERDKDLIFNFQNICFSEEIGKAKITRYLYDLCKIAELTTKDLDVCSKEDIQDILAKLEQTDYAYETKRGFKIVIKKFYRWLRNKEKRENAKSDKEKEEIDESFYPSEVRWIKTTAKIEKQRLPDELLTEEDILKLIQSANKRRDKAFISVLYESGCRIGEIATIKIKNISFDQYGAKITVFGKTGSRPVRLVMSSPYLLDWVNEHPESNNPNSYVWLSQKKELICYGRIKDLLRDTAKKAGIKKRINPHSFRHARATYLAKRLSDSQLKSVMGWTQSSKMSAIYVHLSQRDTDDAILELNGVKREDEEKSVMQQKKCIRCLHTNKATSKFCEICGMVLDQDEADRIIKTDLEKDKINSFMNELSKDPEFMNLVKKKLNL